MGISMNQSIRWIVMKRQAFSVVQLMGSKIAHPHTLPKKEVRQQFTENHEAKSLLFLWSKLFFLLQGSFFRHPKSWRRLMLCHRTGLKLFTIPGSTQLQAGTVALCYDTRFGTQWSESSRFAALLEAEDMTGKVVWIESHLDFCIFLQTFFYVPWEITCFMSWLGPLLSFVRGVWVWLCCGPMRLENMFS